MIRVTETVSWLGVEEGNEFEDMVEMRSEVTHYVMQDFVEHDEEYAEMYERIQERLDDLSYEVVDDSETEN